MSSQANRHPPTGNSRRAQRHLPVREAPAGLSPRCPPYASPPRWAVAQAHAPAVPPRLRPREAVPPPSLRFRGSRVQRFRVALRVGLVSYELAEWRRSITTKPLLSLNPQEDANLKRRWLRFVGATRVSGRRRPDHLRESRTGSGGPARAPRPRKPVLRHLSSVEPSRACGPRFPREDRSDGFGPRGP